MKKVLSAEQMREVDRRTSEEYGVPTLLLMENAGKAVADAVIEKCGGLVTGKKVIVLCGIGNNGGDGAVVSRILAGIGAVVTTLILGKISETTGDALHNFELLPDCESVRLVEFETEGEIREFWKDEQVETGKVDILIDAVFGTGLKRPIEGKYRVFFECALESVTLSESKPLMVSVDLPSGVDADLSEPIGFFFKPDLTVTFTSPKTANVLPPVCRIQGELEICDIGSPDKLIEGIDSNLYLAERRDAAKWLSDTSFSEDSYKKTRGSALIIAGSKTYSGAAVLAGNAALRSGAGLVTVATPATALSMVSERILPEVMVRGVVDNAEGSFGSSSYDEIEKLLENSDAALMGCGLTSEEGETVEFVRRIVENRRIPMVVDADGLNALSPFDIENNHEIPLVLTPHEGEFRRLTGDATVDRVKDIREFACKHAVICVLKGERTLIAAPDRRVVVNPTGNSGLGKAGNGDTLAGLIAGFVAQTAALTKDSKTPLMEKVVEAVIAAVFIGGLAGDIAETRFGKRVMTASDVRDCLSEAFQIAGNLNLD